MLALAAAAQEVQVYLMAVREMLAALALLVV
jgi:hypothetical protein